MNELDFIETVKIQGQGYLLNGTMCVPKAYGNAEYELIKQWLEEGNVPDPEFTEEEIAAQELAKQVQEAKMYLASTDYKMTVDYFATLSEVEQTELINKRAEAREYIRSH